MPRFFFGASLTSCPLRMKIRRAVSYGRCHCVSCIACLFLTDITFHDSPHFLHLCCMLFLESFYSYCFLFGAVLPWFITYLFLPRSSGSQTYYMAHIPLHFLRFTLIGIPSSPSQIVNARITDSSCSFSVSTSPLPLLFLRIFLFFRPFYVSSSNTT